MKPNPLATVLLPLSLLTVAGAQAPSARPPAPASPDWRIPVHTLPADPRGGAYGTWAAGADFKASFHDGFVFHPLLGRGFAKGLPLRWRTEMVTAGGTALLTGTADAPTRQEPWRVEYQHGGVVEAYDVRAEGVEQSFVLTAPPPVPGDVVIRGHVETALRATPRAPEHGPLSFRDHAGQPLVEYGAAFAIDAAGRRVAVATGYDDAGIQLRVDGDWLATASFPVVVDPLLARVQVSAGAAANATVTTTSIASESNPTLAVVTCYTRQFTATDVDAYAVQSNVAFAQQNLMFSDITAAWSTRRAECTAHTAYSRWLIALERDFGTQSAIRVYSHSLYDTTLNSGSTLFLSVGSGLTHREPAIGGSYSNSYRALVVYQEDATTTQANTSTTTVWGQLLDIQAGTLLGPAFVLAAAPAGSIRDREHPCVTPISDNAEGWLVAFEELDRTLANDWWDLTVSRVNNTGGVVFTHTGLGNNGALQHKLQPRIAGSSGHYLMSWVLVSNLAAGGGSLLQCREIEWPSNGQPAPGPIRTVESDGTRVFRNGDLAFDSSTLSHWALVYSATSATDTAVLVTRVGQTGAVTERQVVEQSTTTAPGHPGVAFYARPNATQFVVSYANTDSSVPHPVYGVQFQYPHARNVFTGNGCVGVGSGFGAYPYAGTRAWQMGQQADANAAGVVMIGYQPVALGLDNIGLTACTLRVNPIVFVPLTADGAGNMFLILSLPDAPLFTGDFYTQFAWVKPAANTAGLVVGPGGRTEVR